MFSIVSKSNQHYFVHNFHKPKPGVVIFGKQRHENAKKLQHQYSKCPFDLIMLLLYLAK